MRSVEQYSRTLGLGLGFETSTKTGENIDQAIQYLVQRVRKWLNASKGFPVRLRLQIVSHRKKAISRQQSLDRSNSSLEGMREQLLKIVVIGGLGTGKSAIIRRYVSNTFSSYYVSTVRTHSSKFLPFFYRSRSGWNGCGCEEDQIR